jgi:uncharacterized membrane protein YfcA
VSPTDWAIAMTAVLVGACLQGSLGFGLGLVAAPVLALLDPTLVPTVILGMGVPLTYLVAWRERRAIDLRRIGWAVIGRVLGTIIGSIAVLYLSQRWLAGAFAFALLFAVAISVVGRTVAPTKVALFVAGSASGAMGTATSVGGPPMALLLQHEKGPQLRASLASFMAFGATLSLSASLIVTRSRSPSGSHRSSSLGSFCLSGRIESSIVAIRVRSYWSSLRCQRSRSCYARSSDDQARSRAGDRDSAVTPS